MPELDFLPDGRLGQQADDTRSASTASEPFVSVLLYEHDTSSVAVARSLDSVRRQTDHAWELLIVGNGSARSPGAESDQISLVSNSRGSVLETGLSVARGRYLAVLRPGDLLSPTAVQRLREAVTHAPEAVAVYADEDVVLSDGTYDHPWFKPDWSPGRFQQQDYVTGLVLLRTADLRLSGGSGSKDVEAELFAAVLRAAEAAQPIEHVREILVHRCAPTADRPVEAAAAAVTEHLAREGSSGTAYPRADAPGLLRVRHPVRETPLVSLLLPVYGARSRVRGQELSLVENFLRSVAERTTYDHFEYVIVHDSRMSSEALDQIRQACSKRLTLIPYVEPPSGFNYSDKANTAAAYARGDFLLFLNDDLEVITESWIEELLSLAQLSTTGAVGAMLYYEDETIQHAGVVCADGPAHAYVGLPRGSAGPHGDLMVVREVTAVTGACVCVGRRAFFEVGGLTEGLPNNFNDIDLCLKLRSAGYRNIWTPFAELYHFEGRTRDNTVREFEVRHLFNRWGLRLRSDTYHNPNLAGNTSAPTADWRNVSRTWPRPAEAIDDLDVAGYLELNPDLARMAEDDPTWDVAAHFREHGRYERRLQRSLRPRHQEGAHGSGSA